MDTGEIVFVSSGELEALTGIAAHTIRKDISFLNQPGPGGGKYRVGELMSVIEGSLGLARKPKACVVGLGQLGQSFLRLAGGQNEFDIAAGFDSNINVIELTETDIDLFPAYEIPAVAKERGIELAILTVADHEVEKTAARLFEGGIKGVLNYSGIPVPPEYGMEVRNLSFMEELRILGARVARLKDK